MRCETIRRLLFRGSSLSSFEMAPRLDALLERVESMPEEAYEPYADRVMRSVAHNIGNVVNVISGRLSLLELQDGMGPEALEMIALMRDRLRRTQGELREAVRFVSETTSLPTAAASSDCEVASSLEKALIDAPGNIQGRQALQDERVRGCMSTQPLTPPFSLMTSGLRRIFAESDGLAWRFEANGDGLTFDLLGPAALLPPDRRSLMEPWFDAKAITGSLELRRGRLELATALGRIEDGGGQVSAAKDDGDVSRLRIFWSCT